MCADGWLGPDCSVDVTSGPRVANLANNGLCDVRSKPCRSIIVFGDNFAASDKLVCHFEVFKVGWKHSLIEEIIRTRGIQPEMQTLRILIISLEACMLYHVTEVT